MSFIHFKCLDFTTWVSQKIADIFRKKETCLDMSNVCVHVCKFSEVWTSDFPN